jgi:polyphosphate glucokinase
MQPPASSLPRPAKVLQDSGSGTECRGSFRAPTSTPLELTRGALSMTSADNARKRVRTETASVPGSDAGAPPAKQGGKSNVPRAILAIDIGGTSVKALASGQHAPLMIASGKHMTPVRMVEAILEATKSWKFDAVSIGYPGLVRAHAPHSEPLNLGSGWVGFDFAAAFGKPVKIMNDAAMQALGSYNGGRMLFLGLGTGLGSTLITQNVVVQLELGDLFFRGNEPLGIVLGRPGLKRIGKGAWRKLLGEVVASFSRAFVVDYVVLGGGNAKLLKELPIGARLGHNLTAFRGGFRLWNLEDVLTLSPAGTAVEESPLPSEWRVV